MPSHEVVLNTVKGVKVPVHEPSAAGWSPASSGPLLSSPDPSRLLTGFFQIKSANPSLFFERRSGRRSAGLFHGFT